MFDHTRRNGGNQLKWLMGSPLLINRRGVELRTDGEVDADALIETAGRYGDIGPALRSEANLEGSGRSHLAYPTGTPATGTLLSLPLLQSFDIEGR